ncbi:hypothetical protein [Fluviicola sp.]|uniref:hypothetical protein n=1 Tax=Fluviicola sp. TaxID=1917219 RepID=UPI0031E176E6
MRNVTGILFLAFVFAMGLASCSKEKRIEKNLARKDGKWDVESYEYKYYYNGTYYPYDSFTYTNAGSFVFEKNGTYTWTFIADGESDISTGTWSNSGDELTLVQNSSTVKFKILEESKKKIKIEYTETDGVEKETYTMTLTRD